MSFDGEFWGNDEEDICFEASDLKQEDHESLDKPLYEGCLLTEIEAMVAILTFFLRHQWTNKAALEYLLCLIATFLKLDNSLKNTPVLN